MGFQRLVPEEEPIILGYLLSKYFLGYRKKGFRGFYGNPDPYPYGDENVEDGSGDFPRGRHGKPPYTTANGDLVGLGGNQNGGGSGNYPGIFGQGGNGGAWTSSGGGGGFYGGGSGYVFSGGGGGSSFAYGIGSVRSNGQTLDVDCAPADYMQITEYMEEQGFLGWTPEEVMFYSGLIVGYNPEFSRNANFGNGYAIINGAIFEYSNKTYEYTIPVDGWYICECYGAQGGGINTSDDTTKEYVGGCGGYAKAMFYLRAGMKLYIVTGQTGGTIRDPLRPQGYGGGAGRTQGFAGGGATSIYLKPNDFSARLLVAGGGGGASCSDMGPDEPDDDGRDKDSPNGDGRDKITTGKQMFIISDLSIAHVDINYKCSNDIPEDKYIKVSLYVDGVKRGELKKDAIAGGGFDRWTFDNFDTWLPPNTTPYWACIEAVVETNLEQIAIPVGGLIIWVETKQRPNDVVPLIKSLFGYFTDVVKAKSYLNFFLEEVQKANLSDLDYIESKITVESLLDIYIKVVKKLHNSEVSQIEVQSFLDFVLKEVQNLCLKNYSSIKADSYFKIFFGEEEPEEKVDSYFFYTTSNVGVGSYTAIFLEEKEKIKDLNSVSPLDAQSYNEIKLKTIEKIKNGELSNANVSSYIEVKIKTVPELKIDSVVQVDSDTYNEIKGV